MPGRSMRFSCPCGFTSGPVMVGATERESYPVVLCRTCRRIFSLRKPRGAPVDLNCRRCGNPLTPLTAPGAWGPDDLHERFPDTDPWLLEGGDCLTEESSEEEMDQLEHLWMRCPQCAQPTLRWELEALWD